MSHRVATMCVLKVPAGAVAFDELGKLAGVPLEASQIHQNRHSHVLLIPGPSYRMKDKLSATIDYHTESDYNQD